MAAATPAIPMRPGPDGDPICAWVVITATDQKSGKLLYSRGNWQVREDYELAVDPHQFFDESGPALDRLCGDVARDLVSAVLENF